MDSLSDIAVFIQVVDSGSFTAAAERLSLSKSVISKYVTRLEDRLGARLLNRTTRKLSLTEVGRAFYERSERGLQEIAEAEAEVSRLQGEPRGTLRINAPMSFGVLHIAPVLSEFLERYPQLTVDMNLDDRKVDVIEGGFDVSVRISDLGDSSLVARRIGPCRHVVVASPAYLKRYGIPRTPEDLEDHNVITYQYKDSAKEWEFRLPGQKPSMVSVSGSIQMNNSLALREALLNDAGITRTPTFVVGRDIQEGRLQSVLTNYELPEISIYLVFPQRKYLSPKVRVFVEFMREYISDTPSWDQKTKVDR
ncbi:LysR family transcriptional regulator [Porticoccus hydrocarbonoclasticus]|mgnify:CR=1 FL=1|uniref:LysR family transcriptional regulator n=1 Tax=Porticoccus hydrocarbonoclasticus TaxID=1073414 RepID=UPI002352E383|nr:LysR family transcriptional regulator [Porticoccus hydrocarbonoclasticus]|tara:strand:+ start:18289 stop:19212 length:924 start_codon:yes stop_codon:yes gene_type:complete